MHRVACELAHPRPAFINSQPVETVAKLGSSPSAQDIILHFLGGVNIGISVCELPERSTLHAAASVPHPHEGIHSARRQRGILPLSGAAGLGRAQGPDPTGDGGKRQRDKRQTRLDKAGPRV